MMRHPNNRKGKNMIPPKLLWKMGDRGSAGEVERRQIGRLGVQKYGQEKSFS